MPFIRISVRVPDRIVNVEGVRRAIIEAQNMHTVPDLKHLFGRTVTGWKTPPSFSGRRIDSTNQLGVEVFPYGAYADKYALVNEGARPHVIRPVRARMLRFQVGYRAGTRPRVLSSRAYSRFGDFVRKPVVHHPGFEAREFTQTIAEEYAPEFQDLMNQAIADGAH